MSGYRELFDTYGADYQVTMERFMGNEKLYLKLLNMLFQDTNLQKLGDTLAAGDLTGAFEAAHTLKGVVGNMGLQPLYTAVCAILEPLRTQEARDDYLALYQAVRTEFEKADAFRERLKKEG